MGTERTYSTRRQSIVKALVAKLCTINGTGEFFADLNNNVHPKLKFWDEIDDFPAIHLNAGTETRIYQAGGYKDRFLSITVRCYVKNEDDPVTELDELLEDVETIIEENSRLTYTDKLGATQHTHQSTILSIDTDEGVLEPYGVGEILIEVQY